MRSRVIAERTSALALLAGRRRPIWLGWTTSILMVRSFRRLYSLYSYALLTALGIADEVDRLGLKGSKKKKSKKLDEDWMVRAAGNPCSCASTEARILQPILKPLVLKEVPKVIQAMRQTQSRKVLVKLLTRIKVGV